MERDWWVYSTVLQGRAILVKDRLSGSAAALTTRCWRDGSGRLDIAEPELPLGGPSRVAEDALT